MIFALVHCNIHSLIQCVTFCCAAVNSPLQALLFFFFFRNFSAVYHHQSAVETSGGAAVGEKHDQVAREASARQTD